MSETHRTTPVEDRPEGAASEPSPRVPDAGEARRLSRVTRKLMNKAANPNHRTKTASWMSMSLPHRPDLVIHRPASAEHAVFISSPR